MLQDLLLAAHIGAGIAALVAALIAAGTKMLDSSHTVHVYSGRVFVAGMTVIFLTAVPLSILSADVFLLLVAVFSVYLALSGWSYARNRRGTPGRLDFLRSYCMLAAAGAMVAYGVYLLVNGRGDGITMLVFAGIGAVLSRGDLSTFKAGGLSGTERIARHLSMMLAGVIATVTAVLVVNLTVEPAFVLWLAPTVLITPLIIYCNARIRRRAQ